MTETVNADLDRFQAVFKDLAWDNLVLAATTAFFTWASPLAIPVVRPVVTFFLNAFANFLFSNYKEFVDVGAVKFLNLEHEAAFNRCITILDIVARENGFASVEYKTARENSKKAFAKFVGYNGI